MKTKSFSIIRSRSVLAATGLLIACLGTSSVAAETPISSTEVISNWNRTLGSALDGGRSGSWYRSGTRILGSSNHRGTLVSDFSASGNFTFSVDSYARDNDIFGLVWGFQDLKNHYRMSWGKERHDRGQDGWASGGKFRIFKEVNGGSVLLYSVNTRYAQNRDYRLSVTGTPTGFDVKIVYLPTNTTVIQTSVTDTTYTSGKVGIHEWYQGGSNVWKNFCFGDGNSPPEITSCPSDQLIGCQYAQGVNYSVNIGATDPDNDPLTVTWKVNGVVIPGQNTTSLTHAFAFGVNTVEASVTDGNTDPVTCSTSVTVVLDGEPAPDLAELPDVTGQCDATITAAPTAKACSDGTAIVGTTSDSLTYDAQGTYTVIWTYTDPNTDPITGASATATQTQTVIVKDTIPAVVTSPSNLELIPFGSEPAPATTVEEFEAQGGTITDNCGLEGVTVEQDGPDIRSGFCPIVITRCYRITDLGGNHTDCEQIITVDNLFASDGIMWHQPLARKGMSEDTDPSDEGSLKFRFKLGRTIPIQVHAVGCDDVNVSANSNVSGTVIVYGDTNADGLIDEGEEPIGIDSNGVGGVGGTMDKIDGHLKFNLNTKLLPVINSERAYILEVTVEDTNTGESRSETVRLQAK